MTFFIVEKNFVVLFCALSFLFFWFSGKIRKIKHKIEDPNLAKVAKNTTKNINWQHQNSIVMLFCCIFVQNFYFFLQNNNYLFVVVFRIKIRRSSAISEIKNFLNFWLSESWARFFQNFLDSVLLCCIRVQNVSMYQKICKCNQTWFCWRDLYFWS